MWTRNNLPDSLCIFGDFPLKHGNNHVYLVVYIVILIHSSVKTWNCATQNLLQEKTCCPTEGNEVSSQASAVRSSQSASIAERPFTWGHALPGIACIQRLRQKSKKDPAIIAWHRMLLLVVTLQSSPPGSGKVRKACITAQFLSLPNPTFAPFLHRCWSLINILPSTLVLQPTSRHW